METVSLRLDPALARRIEKEMAASGYSTKTEFIREAIRDRLSELEEQSKKEKAWQALFAARGVLKGKVKFKTDEEFYEWRKNEGSRLVKELYDEKFGLKKK